MGCIIAKICNSGVVDGVVDMSTQTPPARPPPPTVTRPPRRHELTPSEDDFWIEDEVNDLVNDVNEIFVGLQSVLRILDEDDDDHIYIPPRFARQRNEAWKAVMEELMTKVARFEEDEFRESEIEFVPELRALDPSWLDFMAEVRERAANFNRRRLPDVCGSPPSPLPQDEREVFDLSASSPSPSPPTPPRQ